MTLEETLYKDYVTSLKARNKGKIEFLSFIRGELKKVSIDLKKEHLEDNEVLQILTKQKKRLCETKESIAHSHRQDLIDKTESELLILEAYLPKPITDDELESIITETIKEIDATSIKDMGKVMKAALEKIGVQADSKKISECVKLKLSGV